MGTRPPDTQPAPAVEPPVELVVCATAVAGVGTAGRDDHTNVAQALHALADALVLVSPTRTDLLNAIRSAAEQLTSSPVTGTHHADLVRRGFEHAIVAFARGSIRETWRRSEYLDGVSAFSELVRLIDPDQPLLQQQRHVVVVFEAAVSLLELALGVSAERDVHELSQAAAGRST